MDGLGSGEVTEGKVLAPTATYCKYRKVPANSAMKSGLFEASSNSCEQVKKRRSLHGFLPCRIVHNYLLSDILVSHRTSIADVRESETQRADEQEPAPFLCLNTSDPSPGVPFPLNRRRSVRWRSHGLLGTQWTHSGLYKKSAQGKSFAHVQGGTATG